MTEARKKIRRFMKAVLASLLAVTILGGCGRIYLTTGFKQDQLLQINGRYASAAELKVYMLDQIKECQMVMGADALDGAADEDMTRELKNRIREKALNQLVRVMTVNIMAIQDNIMLTNAEKQKAAEAAGAYFESLSAVEKEYLGTDRQALTDMFCRYALAAKTCSSLAGGFEGQYQALLSRIDVDLNAALWNTFEVNTVDATASAANTFRSAYVRYCTGC
jgi:hypothetical protein